MSEFEAPWLAPEKAPLPDGLPTLKRCPFCGGDGGYVDFIDRADRVVLGVECGRCGADIVTYPNSYHAPWTKEDVLRGAAEAWNRRAPPDV